MAQRSILLHPITLALIQQTLYLILYIKGAFKIISQVQQTTSIL